MSHLKPNTTRALNLILLLWINFWISTLTLAASVFRFIISNKTKNGKAISGQVVEALNLAENLIGLTYFVAFTVSAVFFISWFRRAYHNLHQFKSSLGYTDGWAAGGWFIPVINLFMPFKIMNEMYREADHLLTRTHNIGSRLPRWHLSLWWAFWILSMAIGQIFLWLVVVNFSQEKINTDGIINLAEAIVNIPLTVLVIKVVEEYANIEPELESIHQKMNEDIAENPGIFTESEYRRYLDHSA